MQLSGNTILVTGGGSGIGRALAEGFQARGNTVIIAGRRLSALEEVTNANPGLQARTLDLGDAAAIRAFAAQLIHDFPALNTVIHNAGIMRAEDLKTAALSDAEAIIETNLLGPLRLNAALIEHLLAQPRATVMTVSSGLAFVPRTSTPTYSATKAAIHSYSDSLRRQLRDSRVQVIELVPPYVQTTLMGEQQAHDPHALPLADFIQEVFDLLERQPDAAEVLVERVKPLRFAQEQVRYQAVLEERNP